MPRETRIAIGISLDSPFRNFTDILNGILSFADRAGWRYSMDPFLQCLDEPKDLPDGIIARIETPGLVGLAKRLGVPIVNVHHNAADFGDSHSVVPDYRETGRLAAQHLLSRGFQQLGFIGYLNDRSVGEMRQGFCEVLRDRGLPNAIELLVPWSNDSARDPRNDSHAKVLDWIEQLNRPCGVFASRDLLAQHLIHACHAVRIPIPEELGLLCTESCPYLCTNRIPTVSSIDLAFEEVGRTAATLLERLMRGDATPDATWRVMPRGLTPRQSTEFRIVGDSEVASALRFMSDHCSRSISVDDIVASTMTTRRTLERRFREELNGSIASQLARMRVERAKHLLVDTDLLIKQVALTSGFSEPKHFNRCFRRFEGCLPSEYRQRRRDELHLTRFSATIADA